MKKELHIETVQVEICVVRVAGQKMTLATFRQIPEVNFFGARETHHLLGWVKAPAPWPENFYTNKEDPPLNPDGKWILCVDPNGTLQKAAWPSVKQAPRGRQLYLAT